MILMTIRLIVVLVSVLLIGGCKQEPKTLAPEEKQEIIPLIHHEAYIVTVDNLRMRDRAGRKSKVLRKLPEGSIVLSEGVISDFTEKVSLRGQVYDEPYHKVYLRNKSDKQGWVYGGALVKIYYDDTAYPFSTYIDGLVAGMSRQPLENMEDLQRSLTEIIHESTDVPEWNDALLAIAINYLKPVASSEAVAAEVSELIGESSSEVLAQVEAGNYAYGTTEAGRQIRNSGLRVLSRRGSIALDLDIAQVADLISGPYSASAQAYVDIERALTQSGSNSNSTGGSNTEDIEIRIDEFLSSFDKRTIFYQRVLDLQE
jgi:hypothetical protein